ncbi:MAG: homoserine dehydrogenase [Clostridia bacterium]|nr:homoserine dehydrogenase [Clostridia bacterium]
MKIAVLGYGVVGSGVVELVFKNAASIAKNAKENIEIKYIVDIREFPGNPLARLFTKDFEKVLHDKEVETVVEVIGGLNPAYSFVKRSLEAGKNVVTSNKELVATYGDELLQIAKDRDVSFMFEASVGGGIPIIRPLYQCLTANRIKRIYGILNGTTNYILSKMITDGNEFSEALSKAQQHGYAEANPAADIDGLDACRKIAILGSLAYGSHIDPNLVQTEGIRNLDLKDVKFASSAGYAIKLLGLAQQKEDGKVYIIVAPFLLDKMANLSNVQGVFNEIIVEGDAVGETMFYGRGAGKLPTASAVVADVIDCCRHKDAKKFLFWSAPKENAVADFKQEETVFYVRFTGKEAAEVANVLPVATVISKDEEFVAILNPMREYDFYEKIATCCDQFDCTLEAKYRIFK